MAKQKHRRSDETILQIVLDHIINAEHDSFHKKWKLPLESKKDGHVVIYGEGLCSFVGGLEVFGVITKTEEERIRTIMYDNAPKNKAYFPYFFSTLPGQWKEPRVEFIKHLITISEQR